MFHTVLLHVLAHFVCLQLQFFLCQALESIQPYTFRAGHIAKDSLPSCYGIADMMDGRLAYSVIYHFVTKSRQLLAGTQCRTILDSCPVLFFPHVLYSVIARAGSLE